MTLPTKIEAYPSFDAMRAAHSQLLKQFSLDAVGDESTFVEAALDFMNRGQATGALLDSEADRDGAQTMLDYWSSRLYRMGKSAPEVLLDDFDADLAPEIPDELCPYRGLSAFREEDSTIFFGRQKTLDEFIARLNESRMLAVIGPSGSGKSSVVRAGLLPLLQKGAVEGSKDWFYMPIFVPGSDPLRNLLIAITRAEKGDIPEEENTDTHDHSSETAKLVTDNEALLKILEEHFGKNVVIVIDQFEEIFSLCDNETERRAFVQNCLSVVNAPESGHRIILTMRVDFEPKLAVYPDLQEMVEAATVRLTPLTAADLREAIEEPARKIGLKFEEGLIDNLLNDILGEPAALPLLQFTLLKLWENRDRNRITWEDYRKLGGGRQALARSADEFFNSLIPEDQVTARRILLRLVRPGEGLEVTSQRMRRVDLYSRSDAVDRIDRVLEKFIDARLLRLTSGRTSFDDQIEVAHEALVRNWPTLVGWLEDEREAIRQRRRLTIAAERWNELGCTDDLLLRGVELEEAMRYDDLNELEGNFIKASQQARADEIEKEKQTNNNLRRKNRIISIASVVAGVVAVIAVALGVIAMNQTSLATVALGDAKTQELKAVAQANIASTERLRAEEQARTAEAAGVLAQQGRATAEAANTQIVAQQATERAQSTAIAVKETAAADAQQIADANVKVALSRQLADQARSLVSRQTDLGLLLGLESADLGEDLADKGVLLDVVRANPRLKQYLHDHTGSVSAVSYRPDGRMLASAGADLNVVVCYTQTEEPQVSLPSGGKIGVNALGFSPTNDLLAAGTCNELDRSGACSGGLLVLWDLTSANFPTTTMQIHRKEVTALEFDPSGQFIATGAGDGVVQIWSVPPKDAGLWKEDSRFSFTGQSGAIRDMTYTRAGRYLITAADDGTIFVRDIAQAQVIVRFDLKGAVNAVAVTPDGRYLAAGVSDANIYIYDLNRLQLVAGPLSQHTSAVTGLDFSQDGLTLVSSSEDGTLVLWDMSELVKNGRFTNPPGTQILQGHTDAVLTVKFSPDGETLASGGRGAAVIEWFTRAPYPLATNFIQSTQTVLSLGFSPQGNELHVARSDFSVTSWDLESGLASDGDQWVQVRNSIRFPSNVDRVFFQPEPTDPTSNGLALGLRQNKVTSAEVLGVDASIWNGSIDWAAVRQAGYRFAFVRATLGFREDPSFKENWQALKDAGLIRGAYHFFEPGKDPVAQAEFFAQTVPLEEGDLPPVVDIESDDGLGGAAVLDNLQVFLTTLEELTQRKPIIYTIPYFWQSLTESKSVSQELIPVTGSLGVFNAGDYPLWVANYTDSQQPLLPTSWGTWTFWQYTDEGEVSGFDQKVSVSRFNGNLQALESFAKNEPLVAADPGTESTTLVNLSNLEQVGSVLPLLNPTSAALDIGSNTLAVGAANGSITFWNLVDGRQTERVLTYGTASIDSLAFNADGSSLVAGTAEGNILIWDLVGGNPNPVVLSGHTSRVVSLAFGGKGGVLASGSADGSILLWDLSRNNIVGQPLAGPNASVVALAIDGDESLLASGFADGTVLIWDINPDAWAQRACQRAGRDLTQVEWDKYLPDTTYEKTCP